MCRTSAPRQTNYYTAACAYLGLIERDSTEGNRRVYRLTSEARNIMFLPYKKKYMALIKKILERPVFYEAFRIFINNKKLPDRDAVCRIMAAFNMPIGDVTIGRRVSTVISWLKWIIQTSE
jgi:hypothetical protein